jgi:hypothetical protein
MAVLECLVNLNVIILSALFSTVVLYNAMPDLPWQYIPDIIVLNLLSSIVLLIILHLFILVSILAHHVQPVDMGHQG